MRFLVHYVPTTPPIGGIESSPGEQVFEIEAEDKDAALRICELNRYRYIKPMPGDKPNGEAR